MKVAQSCQTHGLYSPWNSPSQDTGVDSFSFLQGTFPNQGSNPGIPHCRQIHYKLSHQGSPRILDPPDPGIKPGSPALQVDFFTNWATREEVVTANTLFQQHKRRLYTWISPNGQYWNQIDYILCSQRWRSPILSAKTRLGADCGSDHKLLTAKFRLKLKKVGKTTRPFTYDLNQIPYNCTVELANRFKGLHLIDRVPEELEKRFMTVQEIVVKTIPKKKKCKKAKWLSEP